MKTIDRSAHQIIFNENNLSFSGLPRHEMIRLRTWMVGLVRIDLSINSQRSILMRPISILALAMMWSTLLGADPPKAKEAKPSA
jgi:hypothetical protein